MSKLTGHPTIFHKIANLFGLRISCYLRFFKQKLYLHIHIFSWKAVLCTHWSESRPVVKPFLHKCHCWYQEGNVRWKSSQDHARLPTSEQCCGQGLGNPLTRHASCWPHSGTAWYGLVWNIVTKNSPGSCYGFSGVTEADFSAPHWAYCSSD